MKQKRWVTGVAAAILVLFLLTGYMAIAAEVGGKTDPLVTFSYVSEELKPTITKLVNDTIAEKTREFQNTLDSEVGKYKKEIDEKITAFESSFSGDLSDPEFIDAVAQIVIDELGGANEPQSTGTAVAWKKVEIESGKTVKASIGTQIVIRLGNATCAAPSGEPGLVNLSSPGTLASGKTLEKSHLYFVTVEGNGFKVTEKATLFICGDYTIS